MTGRNHLATVFEAKVRKFYTAFTALLRAFTPAAPHLARRNIPKEATVGGWKMIFPSLGSQSRPTAGLLIWRNIFSLQRFHPIFEPDASRSITTKLALACCRMLMHRNNEPEAYRRNGRIGAVHHYHRMYFSRTGSWRKGVSIPKTA